MSGKKLEKKEKVKSNNSNSTEFVSSDGRFDGEKFILPSISVPKKVDDEDLCKYPDNVQYNLEERKTGQRKLWEEMVKIDVNFPGDKKPNHPTAEDIYVYKTKDNKLIFGTKERLAQTTKVPTWNKAGKSTAFHIDHIKEYQLSGDNKYEADVKDNLMLLDASSNMSSGSKIYHSVNKKLKKIINSYNVSDEGKTKKIPFSTLGELKKSSKKYPVIIEKVKLDGEKGGKPYDTYKASEISAALHFKEGINLIKTFKKEEKILLGINKDSYVLYYYEFGGTPIIFDTQENTADNVKFKKPKAPVKIGSKPNYNLIEITSMNIDVSNAGNIGNITCTLAPMGTEAIEKQENIEISLKSMEGIKYGGLIDSKSVQTFFKHLKFRFLSPLEMEEVHLGGATGLEGYGTISPTIPFFEKAKLQLVMDQEGIHLDHVLEFEEISLPAFINIDSSEIRIGYNLENGFSIGGGLDFSIDKLGKGSLTTSHSAEKGFGISGSFNLDEELVSESSIDISYVENKLEIAGTASIKNGKIKGIESGTINFRYSEAEEVISISGEANFSIKGLEKANLNIMVNEEGLKIDGTTKISDEIKGIKGGDISFELIMKEGAENYSLKANGKLMAGIDFLDGELQATIIDDLFNIYGEVNLDKGMMKGKVGYGVTNMKRDEKGNMTEEKSKATETYGKGGVKIQLTPWLEAGGTIIFDSNGNISMEGELGIPSSLQLLERKEFNKNLFKFPRVEIPIPGLSIPVINVGLVAFITSELNFLAYFGPITFEELNAKIKYDPNNEDKTEISGTAELLAVAGAFLQLAIEAGISISAKVAGVDGSIVLAASLGVEGALRNTIDLLWSNEKGLEINALMELSAEPAFIIEILAKLEAWALFWSKVWEFQLAKFEYGSGLKFGIGVPIKYNDTDGLSLSMEDFQTEVPEIDSNKMTKEVLGNKVKLKK